MLLGNVFFQEGLSIFLPLCGNRPFYRYGGHIEFIIFMEYYGMPGGNSLSICARFSGKKRTSLYISGEKAIIITSNHGITTFFPHYNFRIVLMPPGHPLILLKSNSVIQYGRRIGKKVCYLCLCVNISDNFRRDKNLKQESLIV